MVDVSFNYQHPTSKCQKSQIKTCKLHINVHKDIPVLVLFLITIVKIITKTSLGDERLYFIIQFTFLRELKKTITQAKNQEADTKADAIEERCLTPWSA